VSTNLDIDTDASDPPSLCDPNNDMAAGYCVVAGTSIDVSARITAHGSKPLVLLSTTTVSLSGVIDVGSHRNPPLIGAGTLEASSTLCQGVRESTGSSGSYGGTFRGQGGIGGDGNPDDGIRGAPRQVSSEIPTALRGGCPGGNAVGTAAGIGGAGGGAVAIVAATSITISGAISASGAGGRAGGVTKSGGGGGGSGGMIMLDAPSIMAQSRAQLFANGGGGGQGGGGTDPGFDGVESTAPQQAGTGGANTLSVGGFGGAGSVGTTLAGGSGVIAISGGGGGGGGGGAGLIRAAGVSGASVISPPSVDP
jgi:hypothetical protein